MKFTGIAASPGIALGPDRPCSSARSSPCASSPVPGRARRAEVARFRAGARGRRAATCSQIRDGIAAELGEQEAGDLRRPPPDPRRSRAAARGGGGHPRATGATPGSCSAATCRASPRTSSGIEDEYLRERRADVLDVERRVLRHLRRRRPARARRPRRSPSVIVAHDLGPSEVAMLDRDRVLGFVTEVGGRTSHSAIVARGRGIPAVVSVRGVMQHVKTGDHGAVDGYAGTSRAQSRRRRRRRATARAREHARAGGATRSASCETSRRARSTGAAIELGANIELPSEVEQVLAVGRRRHRALPHRVLLPRPRSSCRPRRSSTQAYRGVAERLHAAAGDLPHHGPGRRQGGVLPGHDARDQSVPRLARHPLRAPPSRGVPHADPRDLSRERPRPRRA